MNAAPNGKLIIISGPSGAGKSTVVRELLDTCDLPLELSIPATTRDPREGERDGVDYYFFTDEDFQQKRRRGEFLECAEVFGKGQWYGTLEKPVLKKLQERKNVILEIDVQGALQVVARHPDAVTIFIHPGSLQELEDRLRGRKTESESQIQMRLSVAADELQLAPRYQHIVKNENIQSAAREICGLLSNTGVKKSCTTN